MKRNANQDVMIKLLVSAYIFKTDSFRIGHNPFLCNSKGSVAYAYIILLCV